MRCAGSRDEDGSDDEVCQRELFADSVPVAEERVDVRRHDVFQIPQSVDVDVEDRNLGLKAGCNLSGVLTNDSAAEDHDVRGENSGDSAQQDTAAFLWTFEILGAFLNAHASGDFAHRSQQRQIAFRAAQSFISDGRDAAFQNSASQFFAGGEMEVGKDSLASAKQRPLGRLRLFDFDDQVGFTKHGLGVCNDFGPVCSVLLVGNAAACAGSRFDQDTVATLRQLLDAHWQHRDPVFVLLHLTGYADSGVHVLLPDVRSKAIRILLDSGYSGVSDGQLLCRFSRRRLTLPLTVSPTQRLLMSSVNDTTSTAPAQPDDTMFRRLVDGAIYGVLVHRNQQPLYVNDAWARIHGLSVDDVMQLDNVLPLIHPDEQDRMLGYMRARMSGESAPDHYEYRAVHTNGSILWLENLVRPVEWHGEPAIQASIVDITQRRRAEHALNESEERFRRGFEDGPIGVCFVDRDLRFIRANRAFCQLLGYIEEELYELTTRDVTPPEDMEGEDEQQDTTAGIVPDFTVRKRYRRKDGGVVWVRLSGHWMEDEDGHLLYRMSLVENVTERIEARLALQSSERRFRDLVEGSIQGIIIHRDDKPLFVNDAWCQLLGYSSDEALASNTTLDFVAPHEHDRLQSYRSERMNGDEAPERYEYQGQCKDGSLIWLENSVRVVNWDGRPAIQSTIIDCSERRLREERLQSFNEELERRVVDRTAELEAANELLQREIVERARIEEELRRSRALYESLVDTIPLCVARKDLDGRFVFANKALRDMFGLPLEEIVGKDDYAFSPPELCEKYRADDQRVIATGEQLDFVETSELTEGGRRHIHTMKTPIYDPDGTIAGTQLVFWDITEQVEALRIREESQKELEIRNRDLTSLLYVVSHDLKEPVRAIQSFAMLVNRTNADQLNPRGMDFLNRVISASARISELLDDVLVLSRAQAIELTDQVDLNHVVEHALDQLRPQIDSTQAQITVADDLATVTGSERWLTQAVQNLVGNALKFVGENGVPEIEIAPLEKDEGELTGLVVRDRGPGIPEDYRERIFELFQRAVSRRVEGTGAGLAIVRQVAERHGGTALVRPREGGGSEFVITLRR